MSSNVVLLMAMLLVLAALVSEYRVETRYLPTRSNGDRIDKLRELLKDVSLIRILWLIASQFFSCYSCWNRK